MAADNTAYDDIFNEVGQKWGIDPVFLKAHADYESGLNPNFKHPDSSAAGLGAFTDGTAKDYKVDRSDPKSSIDAQARYLVDNYRRAQGKDDPLAAALSMYKTGPNSPDYDADYVGQVTERYNNLKKKNPNGLAPQYKDEAKILGFDALDAAPAEDFGHEENILGLNQISPAAAIAATPAGQDLAKEVALEDQGAKKPAAPAAEAGPSPKAPGVAPTGTLDNTQLAALKKSDPKAFDEYVARSTAAAHAEALTGAGDVPRSLAKTLAAASPSAYEATAEAVSPTYEALGGSPLPKTTADLKTALEQRNDLYNSQYGQDPNQGINRAAGQLMAGLPVMGAAGKAVSAIGSGLEAGASALSPALGRGVAAVNDFIGGKVASNAEINPVTGAVEKTASMGNKLAQYASSGVHGAALALPFTASTAASNNEPVGEQLGINSAISGGLGAAAPIAYDAGAGIGNALKSVANKLSTGAEAIGQKAQSALNQLTGGPIGKLDLTEYVPGSRPTLAEAAIDNPNVAALHTVLKEGNPNSGELVIPDLTARERENDVARRSYLDSIIGSHSDLEAARAVRRAETNKLLYGNPNGEGHPALQPTVWQSATKPTDVQPVVDTIDNILTGPNRKNEAVISAMKDIKEKLVNGDGSLERDPETLYRSVIKDINDKLDKATPMDQASQNMQAATVQVQKVKNALNAQIKDATPGYGTYLDSYHNLSGPVDEYKALQNIDFLNEKSDQGVPTLKKVNNALDSIVKKQNADKFSPADSVSAQKINMLQNLQKDLQRAANPQKLLRIAGSPTDPKIAARGKVKDVLGTNAGKNLGTIGGSSGAMVGGFLGEHFGGGIGATIGAPIGEEIGRRGGNYVENALTSRSSLVRDQLVNTMLNPGSYSASAPATSYLKSVGERPILQQLLRTGVPAGVVARNNFLSAQ